MPDNIKLSKAYDPALFEDKWYKYWLSENYFSSQVDSLKEPYVIVIPPPNVTSRLHMGHGLNNTIQDILIRWKKMSGFNTLWIPGTDHAGIATQNVVEKELLKTNKSRHSFTRQEFVDRVWEWKKEYGFIITEQLKKLGSACDWDRERFTMDKGLSIAVREAFVRLYEDGLIYKGKYIVNWCPRCATALSSEEAEHKDIDGFFYHIKYLIKDGNKEYLSVATTRPETMLGDSALAVNPNDTRYKHLIGKIAILPLLNREIPIIADRHAKQDFGSGVVKITPAHDPNDFLVGKRHGLSQINVMNKDATMNANAGSRYEGLSRFECRDKVVEDLEKDNLFIKKEQHRHSVGHCYRCDTIVEPYLSNQWFVKMKPLAKKAIELVKDSSISFYPKRWTKVYLHWMENIEDWCISRQIWWGHRIPVWTCSSCLFISVSREDLKVCTKCSSTDIKQDEDVLDTWFSSWLWPLSTLGWPNDDALTKKELAYFYPTSVLSTAPEILFFWVARMIMAGLYFVGDIPFTKVYLHSTVRDKLGRKMSKSLGNGIDPISVIEKHGADALRFTITSLAPIGQDIKLAFDKNQNDFLMGSRFSNKLWNLSRYILMSLEGANFATSIVELRLCLLDRWILHRLNNTIKGAIYNLEAFRFNDLAKLLYDFVWHDFCDWYVEFSKVELYKESAGLQDDERKETINSILLYVLSLVLKLLHPIMPFITEEIWSKLPGIQKLTKAKKSIVNSSYPSFKKELIDLDAEEGADFIKDLVYNIRNIRAEMNISHTIKLDIVVSSLDSKLIAILQKHDYIVLSLARLSSIKITSSYNSDVNTASVVVSNAVEVFIPLGGGIIDLAKEKARIQKELFKVEKEIGRIKARLENKTFIQKAKEEVVLKEKEKLIDAEKSFHKLQKNLLVFS